MEVGLHVVNFSMPEGPGSIAETLGDIAVASERVGLTHLSLMDHFFQLEMLGGAELDMLEGYTAMGFVAAKTSIIQLGLLVTGVTYRHPGLLAKTVTTLDVLSNGRAELGIGAAWYDREHHGLGVPFPPLGERFERLEEALQICLQMWSDDNGRFDGKHYTLEETRNVPQSIQRPHPPIMIGGCGEQKTLRLVAQYADSCNLFSNEGLDGVGHKLEVLQRHCADVGSDFGKIRKTLLYVTPMPSSDAQEAFVDEMRGFHNLGIEMVIVMPGAEAPVAEVEGLAPVVAALAEF